MPEAKTIDPSLTTEIVRSYVAHNTIAAGELPNLIAAVHRSIAELGGLAEPNGRVGGYPAVPLRQWHRQTAGLRRLFSCKGNTSPTNRPVGS